MRRSADLLKRTAVLGGSSLLVLVLAVLLSARSASSAPPCDGTPLTIGGTVVAVGNGALRLRPAGRDTLVRVLVPPLAAVRLAGPAGGAPPAIARGDDVVVHACGSPAHLVARKIVVTPGIRKIKHVVIVMQENRSFDEYFGTYPGADGFTMKNGTPTACLPQLQGSCVPVYHDPYDANVGGPHGAETAVADVDGGRMDGFVQQAQKSIIDSCNKGFYDICTNPRGGTDVVGYHDQRELPNYWRYAQDFVLQDHLFESNLGWSLPSHLYLLSAWSALCSNPLRAATCQSDLSLLTPFWRNPDPVFGWTDITYLLYTHGVSWAYYLDGGAQPDCPSGGPACATQTQSVGVPSIWNPLPSFVDVRATGQLAKIQDASNFFTAAANGTLPAVSWVIPNEAHSEHPPSLVSAGQNWVTKIVNTVMQGPDWRSTAIFVAWDDWGGFYDHVVPPVADENGYGLRVPGLVISAYAKRGYIDHQTLSFDAYLRFVEDDFLGGQRLDPRTDGRPDPRPTVRETSPLLGNLAADFDFGQLPRPPEVLQPVPTGP